MRHVKTEISQNRRRDFGKDVDCKLPNMMFDSVYTPTSPQDSRLMVPKDCSQEPQPIGPLGELKPAYCGVSIQIYQRLLLK
jgi:hypothetical protein